MEMLNLGSTGLMVSEIAMGCMRMKTLSAREAEAAVDAALEAGINFFDHATVYGAGLCEELFGGILRSRPALRERLVLQTKIGIRPGEYYDSSRAFLLESVDASLKRLGTDYLDVVLLHRPDPLLEPEEVAEAFSAMKRSGKVRYFGVSNLPPALMELLGRFLTERLIVNQLQFSAVHAGLLDGMVTMNTARPAVPDYGVLDYCRLHEMTVQAWSPLQYGRYEGAFLGSEKYPTLTRVINEIAAERGVTSPAIAAAWILRHPARMQVIAGSMNPAHIASLAKASGIALERREWYAIYRAAGYAVP